MRKFLTATLLITIAVFALTIGVYQTSANAEENTDLTTAELNSIKTNCAIIRDNLKNIQHEDASIFVHLLRYYNTIETNFITPLNVILVSNNLSNVNLIENQKNFVSNVNTFENDYKNYQKNLEELVSINCSVEPLRFYTKLTSVREMRAKVATETTKIRSFANKQITLVTELKENL